MKRIEKETKDKLMKLSKHIEKVDTEDKKKIKKQKKATFKTAEVVTLVLLTAIISLGFGSMLVSNYYYSKFEYTKADSNLQSFLETYEEVKKNYYEKVDGEELIDGAIDGMLKTLDDYSVYYDEAESNNFNITLDGEYEGLGVSVYNDEDGNIVILEVMEDSPASRAKLEEGDILTKYNGKSIKGKTTTEFVKMVKEDSSKKFTLTYLRGGKSNDVTVSKSKVILKSVDYKMYDDNKIGYIYMSVFANNSYKQFKSALEEIEKNNIKSLIIDLRSNTGGHLTSAEDILSLFLDKTHPIYQINDKGNVKTYYSSGKKTKKYKIVILVNSSSASASEVVTSALKEQLSAVIVGTKTYGKGTVQEMQNLANGNQFKITTKTWLTSKGKEVNGKGIDVDVSVSLSDDYADNPIEENDNQLNMALKEARK